MSRDKDDVTNEFGGIAKDVFPVSMPSAFYQEDQGGDRFFRGSWRRRLGMLHTDLAQYASPVTSLIGFEMAGEDFALMVVEGENVHGELNVTNQDYTVPDPVEGWGETEFGEEMGE